MTATNGDDVEAIDGMIEALRERHLAKLGNPCLSALGRRFGEPMSPT